MEQMLIEKTKNSRTEKGLFECGEIPFCPVCETNLAFQKNHVFVQKVIWTCENANCPESTFMRIKAGNKYFLIKP